MKLHNLLKSRDFNQKSIKLTNFVDIYQYLIFYKFSSGNHVPPKIIKNRLNFAPTYVYTAGKIHGFQEKTMV